jgi:formylglycine-generating enzyme required for sulfatase activity
MGDFLRAPSGAGRSLPPTGPSDILKSYESRSVRQDPFRDSAMAKIFVSYRRQDSRGVAGRIYDRLRAHFGPESVTMDIDSIPFGVDFRRYIESEVASCDIALVVVGPNWAGKTFWRRRIDDPRDFVRIEVEAALERDIPVIPILIDHTAMPGEADLPPSLAALACRNAIDVDQGRDFHHHVDLLIKGIERFVSQPGPAASGPAPEPAAPAAARRIAAEKGAPRSRRPTDEGHRPAAMPTSEPGVGKSAPLVEPAQAPKRRPVQSVSPMSNVQAMPAGAIQAQGTLEGSRFWLSAAGLTVLALLGMLVFLLNGTGTVKIKGTDARAKGGDSKAASRSPNLQAEQEPATSATGTGSSKHVPTSKTTAPHRTQAPRDSTNSIGMKFVRIEPGEFMMGTSEDQVDKLKGQFPDSDRSYFADEQPQHRVQIMRGFLLGVYEVTQGQYQEVMGENPSQFKGPNDLPVERVSWLDAVKFCNKLSERDGRTSCYRIDGENVTIAGGNGYRLPSEAEWEYACRAGTSTVYPFGDDPGALGDYAWYGANSVQKPHPVGQKRPDAWGLYDMLGNVDEWCADWYDATYYASSEGTDPPGAARASFRVLRGGSWHDVPRICRPACRYRYMPGNRSYGLGFRVAAVQE